MRRIPHWPFLVVPALSFALGFLLNKITMAFNGGQMPVLMPGGCANGLDDMLHSCMTHASHLRWLADWAFVNGLGVASPGDLLIWIGQGTWDYAFVVWVAFIVYDHNRPAYTR